MIEFIEAQRFRPFDLLPRAGEFHVSLGHDAKVPYYIDTAPKAPYLTIQLAPETETDVWEAGLRTPSGTVRAVYDLKAAHAQLRLSSARSDLILVERCIAGQPEAFAVTFTENTVALWGLERNQWHVLVTHRLRPDDEIDLRGTESLAVSRLFYKGRFTCARAGYFGHLGLRDPQLIRTADGEPIRDDGRFWITATCAGPGFFHTAHWAVFSFPEDRPEALRLESHLFFERDGARLGDHAGFVIRDNGRFVVGVSSWGDFDNNAHVRSAVSAANILRGVHVLGSRRWPLPTDHSTWDPSLVRYQGVWWLAFVECTTYSPRFTFRPALAKTRLGTQWNSVLDYVGADTVHQQTEGTLLTLRDGSLYVLASDGDARDYPVYDLKMNRIDTLDAPYLTNIPHPLLVGSEDSPFILTFDGTSYDESHLGYGTHGDVVVFRGALRAVE